MRKHSRTDSVVINFYKAHLKTIGITSPKSFLLDSKELNEFAMSAKTDTDIKNKLITNMILMVEQVASKLSFPSYITGVDTSYDDLVQYGMLGVYAAIDSYDINSNVDFALYCNRRINSEIKMHVYNNACTIQRPYYAHQLTVKIDKTATKLNTEDKDKILEYMHKHYDMPTVDVYKNYDLYKTGPNFTEILEEVDQLTVDDDLIEEIDNAKIINKCESILSTFTKKEQDCFTQKYFENKYKSDLELAKIYNFDRTEVRQCAVRVLKKLQQRILND